MSSKQLDIVFRALADPTRRAILEKLSKGEATVTELAGPFDMSMPAISRHLKVLERAGLVIRTKEAQLRPCHLEVKPLKEAANWVDYYRSFWEHSLDRLDSYLQEVNQKESSHGNGKK